ncbi:MAG: hypothetical protein WA702_11470 [Bradyrhizobium sp.]|jgi:hypothetical protein|uniref:hypothetical protein n=1 Tax=Bradyrhizobium sp. TaxID=376 RepID=UPI003C7B6F6D
MSVSSLSTTPSPPAPAPSTDPSTSSSQQANNQQNATPNLNKDGDQVAAEQQQTARAPLPPGQGTRVDMLV